METPEALDATPHGDTKGPLAALNGSEKEDTLDTKTDTDAPESQEAGKAGGDEDVVIVDKEELEQRIIRSLKTVFDPEIPVNIYDLGLIYQINIYPDQTVYVQMTLTAPGCPVAGSLPQEAENAVRDTEGVKDARVELTFDPPYTMDMMSDEAKFELGFL